MGRLEGKVAVVTGANSGIGLATAKRSPGKARASSWLAVVKRNWMRRFARSAPTPEACRPMFQDRRPRSTLWRVKQEAGHIDILFANAGVGDTMALPDITEEHFDRIFATNVKGTLFTVQKALPLLRDGARSSSRGRRLEARERRRSASIAPARRRSATLPAAGFSTWRRARFA